MLPISRQHLMRTGTALVAALLSACSAAPQSAAQGPASAILPSAGFVAQPRAGGRMLPGPLGRLLRTASTHPNHAKSWMRPDAFSKKLLYVSDLGAGDVEVYTYPYLTLAGVLTGFVSPVGMCTDPTGNVWVTDGAGAIYEFAHGGTSPVNVLADPGAGPAGCAINPKTGDLAVTNASSSEPSVAIFRNAQGVPAFYDDSHFGVTTFVGFDNQGNLFVDGLDPGSAFHYAELPAGSSTFTDITLNSPPQFPGGVQWDGTYVAIGDEANHIYQTQGSTVVGTTTLETVATTLQFYITPSHKKVIAPDNLGADAGIYRYPAGGTPIKSVAGGLTAPAGAVLSQ